MFKNNEDAYQYFLNKTKKVYVERGDLLGIESFEKYLKHRYRDNVFFYSVYALLGLNLEDILVRGKIDLDTWKEYEHDWVEFSFKDTIYVFDSMTKGITPKNEYYKKHNPNAGFKITQRELLDTYLTEEYAIEIKKGIWQFKNISCSEENDKDILNALNLLRIEVCTIGEKEHHQAVGRASNVDKNEKVKRVIAYDNLAI